MKNYKLLIGLIIFFISIVIIVILLRIQPDRNQKSANEFKKSNPIRLAVPRGTLVTPVWVAFQRGFFTEEGLDVELIGEFTSGKGAFENMLAGHADFSTPATTPVVANSFLRDDYSIFATFTTTYEGVKLIARKDKGISGPSDLKGKRIGIVAGTISEILIDTLLAFQKILPEEVEFKAYKAGELPAALANSEVDAISVWEPHALNALEKIPENAVKIPTSKVYRMAINMAVMNDYAAKHPDILVKVVKALIKSVEYIRQNQDDAQTVMAENQQLDKTLVAKFWREMNFSISLDQLLILTMENEANWINKKSGDLDKKMPNFLRFIHYQTLEAVSPKLVTITRKQK